MRSYAGQQAITLDSQDKGEITVQLGAQAATTLAKTGFEDGSLSGHFAATSNLPAAKDQSQQLALEAVLEKVVFMLPSFVRFRRASAVR